ncbi:hypothetical protein DL96DRAFT_1712742 [Flagelloscypha sp. PMI_526]|nr:hypothetical protein DL96DRAFT_1712742 [Flagelloscypha sp. PMI_526]
MRLLYGPEKRLVTAKKYNQFLGIQNPKLPGPLYDPRPFEAPIPFHYDPNPPTLLRGPPYGPRQLQALVPFWCDRNIVTLPHSAIGNTSFKSSSTNLVDQDD